MPTLVVNGEKKDAAQVRTVRDLIAEMGFTGRAVAVEVNKKVVPRKQHDQTPLRDGDVVEVVTLVGGG